MLVLSRKVGERIIIGGDVTVVVLGIRGNRAKLGIVAPEGVNVRRPDAKPRDEDSNVSPAPTT